MFTCCGFSRTVGDEEDKLEILFFFFFRPKDIEDKLFSGVNYLNEVSEFSEMI